ncbi:MAG: hypothetical protein AAFY00_07240, partial [Bacteroidota bacterium]
GLFLVAMPLFLIKESKGKKMKDYMLNKENIEKMQANRTESNELVSSYFVIIFYSKSIDD